MKAMRVLRKNKYKKKIIKNATQPTDFVDQLLPLGLGIRTMTLDGNSLFRAISDQIIGHESSHHKIRKEIVEYMSLNPDQFSPFYVGDFNAYLTKMSNTGIKGSNMELTAAAKQYKVDIVIHQLHAARYEILYAGKPQRSIHLFYHDRTHYHYASVRLLNDMRAILPALDINLNDDHEQREQQRVKMNPIDVINDKDLEMKNEIIMARSGCYDINKIHASLEHSNNDIDSTNEKALVVEEFKEVEGDSISSLVLCSCGYTINTNEWTFCMNCGCDLADRLLHGLEDNQMNMFEAVDPVKQRMSQNGMENIPLCKYFKNGCNRGSKCRFRHVFEENNSYDMKQENKENKQFYTHENDEIFVMEPNICASGVQLLQKKQRVKCTCDCGSGKRYRNCCKKLLNDKCRCGSGKKYKKCCKKLEKHKDKSYNIYKKNDYEMDPIDDLNKIIKVAERQIFYFKGKKQIKIQMIRELEKTKVKRNELMKKLESKISNWSKAIKAQNGQRENNKNNKIHEYNINKIKTDAAIAVDKIKQQIANFKGKKRDKKRLNKKKKVLKAKNKEIKNEFMKVNINDENNQQLIEQTKQLHIMEMKKMQQQIDTLKLENDKLKQQNAATRTDDGDTHKVNTEKECVFCMDAYRCYAFVPCGHLCLCIKCKDLVNETCPICQNKYVSLIKIYS